MFTQVNDTAVAPAQEEYSQAVVLSNLQDAACLRLYVFLGLLGLLYVFNLSKTSPYLFTLT